MLEKVGHIKNPLTVISMFAAIAEISGTTVLPFIATEHQGLYVWFLMLFPVFLVAIFFLTLNFNHRVLYAPSDYKNENHFFGLASEEEIKNKAEREVQAELSKEDLPDEVEEIEVGVGNEVPEGISDAGGPRIQINKDELVQDSLKFESNVLNCLSTGGIPFKFNDLKKEVSISAYGKKLLIDGVIETNRVHYLIEVKNIIQPSLLVNAVTQIEKYKSAYERYLSERDIRVAVQPIIVVPTSNKISNVFRGIPIVKFDPESRKIINMKDSYPDYGMTQNIDDTETLRSLLVKFLKNYSRWAFSPLRIQKWGSKQSGFEQLELYSIDEIRRLLELLLKKGKLLETTSKKGNKLYKFNPNQSLNPTA